MLSERAIELAHPEAFDFVFGNLPSGQRAEFNRHLLGCRHCQGVVDEYSEIGTIMRTLPPHVEPPADLEDRTVIAMVAALAVRRAARQPQPQPESEAEPETWIQPRPHLQPAPADPPAPAESPAHPVVTPLPLWRRNRSRLAVIAAVAAAVIAAAIVVPLSLGGGGTKPARATFVIPLHVTAAAKTIGDGAATGRATARQDASGSWEISLTVQHLTSSEGSQWYQCWYRTPDGQTVASAGTFRVPDSGSWTFSMTAAVDPHDFSMMEITLGPPGKTGALQGTVVLSGQTQ